MATVTAVRQVSEVTIKLSPREAEVLTFVLARVGGSVSGPRRAVDEIVQGLYALGFSTDSADICTTRGARAVYIEEARA